VTAVVRAATPATLARHLAELSALLVEAVGGGASLGFVAPLALDDARDYWLSLRSEIVTGTRLLLVAEEDDRLVGAGQLALPAWPNARHRAELQKLCVAVAARGRGIGRTLVSALHDAARARGRSLILLNARHDSAAERLYVSLGYRRVGVIPGHTLGPAGERHDSVSLYRDLAKVE